ncbi:hypothetical protein FISHEDRAFT_43790 [Fistulina hepatica ATCC 64428]|uniref:ABC transporter domain-containing protein n=1 Tax=Fistulina hepatica ATCC 64428 TaxID=1128425 RepID=A0A0D7AEB0_9AGAR|nr:hypothetical protein FISHEDRAFT_43790 [Fistulina hepatica ATCC 64428]
MEYEKQREIELLPRDRSRLPPQLSFSDVFPVDLVVRDLDVYVELPQSVLRSLLRNKDDEPSSPQTKSLLNGVSADFARGSLTAVMGGSGSGKTTFLNALSRRLAGSKLTTIGNIQYNGSPDVGTISSAYITQNNFLLPSLTVRETLMYAARLQLPFVSAEQCTRHVEEIIFEVGLKDCADTRVGDGQGSRGCSGGERRRVSIGVQMLSNPSVLFADEPTTGLDATSAYQVAETLRYLANKGRTIICTIHQPRRDIFQLFDSLILFSRGRTLYAGPAHDAVEWFGRLVPDEKSEHMDPADFLIHISIVDSRNPEAQAISQDRVDMLAEGWRARSAVLYPTPKQSVASPTIRRALPPADASFLHQFSVLARRDIVVTIRDQTGIMSMWSEGVLMGLACGLIFLNLPRTLSGIRSREAALYATSSLQGYLILLFEIWRLARVDIAVFDRERGEGLVAAASWLLSRRISYGLLEDIIVPLGFSVISYFMCGFNHISSQFFKFFSVILLNQYVSISLATICVATTRNFAKAAAFGNLVYTFQSIASGFFMQADTIPVYVRWLKWISYQYYSFGAVLSNEFTGQMFDCPSGTTDCQEYEGNWILRNLSFNPNWYPVPVCAMLGFIAFFNLVSLVVLHFVDSSESQAALVHNRSETEDNATGKKNMRDLLHCGAVPLMIDVDLRDLTLDVRKYTIAGRRKTFRILNGITTRFEAGKVNVIMGPSGSGKSSILNVVTARLHSTLLSKFRSSGQILLNGTEATPSILRALVSYVTQGDEVLLPYLTVREMLRFSAALRLPSHLSLSAKYRRAEEVLVMMGLSECADTLIGDETTRGISGGEKRRTSVAVQLLTDPKILMSDFSPTSVVFVFFFCISANGGCIFITIHQSRAELFDRFGNILLLAKGGRIAYSGSSEHMLEHFRGLGHPCPASSNPSNWAVDLVSVDTRHSKSEAADRAKVESLLSSFRPSQYFDLTRYRTVSLPAELLRLKKVTAPIYKLLPILLQRGLVRFKRQPEIPASRVGQSVAFAGIVALFFSPLHRDYYAASVNIVSHTSPVYFIGVQQNVVVYPSDRDIFYNEYIDEAYSVQAFILAYTILEVPFEIIAALLVSLMIALAMNLGRSVTVYFVVAFSSFAITNCGESLGIIFNTLFSNTGFALNVMSIILSLGTFMGGLMSLDMNVVFQGLNYISPVKYAIDSIFVYSVRGMEFTCTDAQKLDNGQCQWQTGAEVLDLYHLNVNPGPRLAALAACVLAYRLVAGAVVKVVKMDFGMCRRHAH